MRLFIAIPLSLKTKDSIHILQNKLKQSKTDINWVSSANTHITLKFLGEISESKIKDISESIKKEAESNYSFVSKITDLDSFPNSTFPKIVWLGLDKLSEEKIKKIALNLENDLEKKGFKKETRNFTSHITIGRIKSNLNIQNFVKELLNTKKNLQEINFEEFVINKITLFKSILTDKGPIYEVIGETNLKTI